MENGDFADVVISVNDDMNVILRVEGFGAVVEHALKQQETSGKSDQKKNSAAEADRLMVSYIHKEFGPQEKNGPSDEG